MHHPEPSPSAHLSLLKPISPDAGYADYLTELSHELPLSVSQFGLVLHSALEHRDRKDSQGQKKNKGPEEEALVWEPDFDMPHFKSSLPVQDTTGKDIHTAIDVTVAHHANTLYARCEDALMQAAAAAAPPSPEGNVADSHYSFKATAENFERALENDPVIQGHQKNIVAVMADILNRPAAKETPPGQDKPDFQFFYCINDIWTSALATFGQLSDGNRGVKYVITEESLLKADPEVRRRCQELQDTEGLVLGPMVESDVPLMIKLNGVKYDEEYGRFIIKKSCCFRNKKGDAVAWAGTHGDFSIAALHVLPEYRKTGLGRLILHSLAIKHFQLMREILATQSDDAEAVPSSTLVAHADCLEHNLATMVFMERCGWHRIGYYLWIGVDQNA